MRKALCLLAALVAAFAVYGANPNGTITTTYNVVAHAKPTVALANLGAGLVTNGTHSWKITFLDAAGESLPSAASSVLTTATATNGKVYVTVPTFPGTATGANVYRTVSGDTGDYKLVNVTPILAAGAYTDNIGDGSLGASAPTANTTGVATAPTPTVALANLGAGAIENGTRTYKFTAVNAGGESMAGTASSAVVSVAATNGKAIVTVPSLAADQVSFRVYREKAANGTWYLNDTAPFSAAVAPGVYTDNTADTALSATEAPGSDTTSPTVAPPSAAGAAVAANLGAGLVTTGTHSYKFQWTNATGHSLQSATQSSVMTTATATNGKVNVTVPTLASGATGCNIYRTAAGDAGSYLLVNPSPVTAGVYVDNIADGSLGAALTATNTTGIPAPSAPTVALWNAGAGLCTTGSHTVKAAYVTASGVSTLSTASDAVVSASTTNGKIVVSVVASSNPSVTSVNLYMTEAGGTDYHLAASGVANASADTTLNLSDATLIAQGAAPTSDASAHDYIIQADATPGFQYILLRNLDGALNVYFTLDGSTVSTSTSFYLPPTSSAPYNEIRIGPFMRLASPIRQIRLRTTTGAASVQYQVME